MKKFAEVSSKVTITCATLTTSFYLNKIKNKGENRTARAPSSSRKLKRMIGKNCSATNIWTIATIIQQEGNLHYYMDGMKHNMLHGDFYLLLTSLMFIYMDLLWQ